MLYHTKTAEETLEELNVSDRGLATTDAAERLRIYGLNTVKVTGEPFWRKLIEPFANVFMLVLFIAASISFLDGGYVDATIILLIMAASAAIYYVQRFSTEKILRTLQKHDPLSVEVMRDGKAIVLDAEVLVPGDIITLGEGEKVPADARLLTTNNLRVDESQLTGESLPISKVCDVLPGDKEIYERINMLFQGSFVVGGEATAIVVTTGNDTEFGQLAALTSGVSSESPVQQKIDVLLTQIIAVVAGMAVIAFGLSIYRGMDLAESLRFIIALSVSAVPESLPVAISVILVLGMRRMATKKALVRTMRAIETIGAITTIATDKTGTLTKNKLTVQAIWQPPQASEKITHMLSRTINYRSAKLHDPLDTALHEYVQSQKLPTPKQTPFQSFPFDQSVSMSGNVWHSGASYELIVKGAPEQVLSMSDLTEGEHEAATAKLHELTSQGYRVIALAHAGLQRPIKHFHELNRSIKLNFDGYVAIADVLRPDARAAIQAAMQAGVTVRMITGDHFETAYHIGRQLGMVTHRDQIFDSRRLHVMTDEELEEIIESVRVFSRVIPEHKYRILALLKKNNITAMTGDGVNDVPALSNAHVGVAMGSGAQIAKDAGDIILIDDNFKGIVTAMHEGRTIVANIRRMIFYLLATNTGEVLTMIGALIINVPIPLLPVQILWVNLVTDTAMVIPLGLEPGEKANMTQRPKAPNAPILSRFMVSRMILLAITMATLTLGLYTFYTSRYGEAYGRAVAFSALVVMQWASALCARSDYESLWRRLRVFNGKFIAGLAIAIILQSLVLFGPLGPVLHVRSIAIGDLVLTGILSLVVPVLLMELHKFIGRRFYHKGKVPHTLAQASKSVVY